ncbi:MAG: excinuclease ABC subunit C [Ignavibacteria bacterium]|nr:excinuclease ABC subunit C [Ignavibacteria bacterium]
MEQTSHSDLDNPLERKLAGLPQRPGVYIHKDSEGTIIYVGKARNLRNRVKAYFSEGRYADAKTVALRRRIADFDVIVTDTEPEALILENTLIKEHQPRYNVLLKDDKSYPYIRITKEEFPQIFKTRRVVRDGSKYFGPYTDGTYLYYLLKTLRSVFPIRTCDLPLTEESVAKGRFKVCLEYHIKKCDGPCEGFIGRLQYNEYIKQAQQILAGRTRELETQMELRMAHLADELRFEDAAVVRHRLEKLREYAAKQKVVDEDGTDRDVFAFARIGTRACTVVLIVRDGRLVGKRHFFASTTADQTDAELVDATVERWYVDAETVPDEVLLPVDLPDEDVVTAFLTGKKGRKVDVLVPQIGTKKKLVGMAETNADYLLREFILQQAQKDQAIPHSILSLQRDLRLPNIPHRIECFDNSHIQGTEYVSSMVVFIDGKPKKSEYRKYKLRSVDGNDDFAAMQEVIDRRFAHREEESVLPDLVIIDGGKGQLSRAVEVLKTLGLEGKFTVVGMAKKLEDIFFPGEADAVILPKTSGSLRLLQQVRDEAHRFAITYHRQLRSNRTLQTELTAIRGVGERTAERLLIALGSVERIRLASEQEIANHIGQAQAKKIFAHFHSEGSEGTAVQP